MLTTTHIASMIDIVFLLSKFNFFSSPDFPTRHYNVRCNLGHRRGKAAAPLAFRMQDFSAVLLYVLITGRMMSHKDVHILIPHLQIPFGLHHKGQSMLMK